MFKCDHCNKSLKSEKRYQQHMRTHTMMKAYSCPECGKGMSSPQYLRQHMETHTNREAFTCSKCGKVVSSRQYLKQHEVSHSDAVSDTLKLKTENGDAKFEILIPGAASYNASLFLMHDAYKKKMESLHKNSIASKLNAKSGVAAPKAKGRPKSDPSVIKTAVDMAFRPYQCTFCTKRFQQKANLQAHARIHTDERPFNCQYCERRFRQLSALQVHTRIHTDERPFECQYCDRSFHQQSNLRLHTLSHIG